ncbi:MAG: FtsX-like permease family protein [Paracoccaceae bacterium]
MNLRAIRTRYFGAYSVDQIVPPRGNAAWATIFTTATMTFLAVAALAAALAGARFADAWSLDLAQNATVRIAAPAETREQQIAAVLAVLDTTPGIASAEVLDDAAQARLLAPWLGNDLPLDALPLPAMISVALEGDGPNSDALALRLAADAPDAVWDDHDRWRAPLQKTTTRARMLAISAIVLITAALGVMITLAARAALAQNAQVIITLRLVGARDRFIIWTFVRRFTMRALIGSVIGAIFAIIAVQMLADATADDTFLSLIGFSGLDWALLLAIPFIATFVAFNATRQAAMRHLLHQA